MPCCPCCCCENKKLPVHCKACGQNVCKHCFITCEGCYDDYCIDCESIDRKKQDLLCVDCLGKEEKLFHKLKQAENVLKIWDGNAEEDDTECVDYSLFKPRELCDLIEDLKYKLIESKELSKEKDMQMEILREKIKLLEEQNTLLLLKEHLNKKLK